MRRDQLEHAIRTACQIIQHREVIIVGSQAILRTYDESQLPRAATMSIAASGSTTRATASAAGTTSTAGSAA